MKITIEDKDYKVVYEDVTDVYYAIRQLKPLAGKDEKIGLLPETRSYSRTGGNIRELIKEMSQSITEMQEKLRNGNINAGTK